MFALLSLGLLASGPAQAYIGPGTGAGAIAVVLGILASIIMAFFALLWYPVKRLLKKRRLAREAAASGAEAQGRSGGNARESDAP